MCLSNYGTLYSHSSIKTLTLIVLLCYQMAGVLANPSNPLLCLQVGMSCILFSTFCDKTCQLLEVGACGKFSFGYFCKTGVKLKMQMFIHEKLNIPIMHLASHLIFIIFWCCEISTIHDLTENSIRPCLHFTTT